MSHYKASLPYLLFAVGAFFAVFAGISAVNAAGQGTITSLTASSSNPSAVSATLAAASKINNSNVTFQIFDSKGALVGSYGPISISLDALQSTVVSWSWPVSGTGPFSATACWSPGNSRNCGIDKKTSTFTAVSSLGDVFLLIGAVLIAVWFWRTRKQLINTKTPPSPAYATFER